MQEYKFSETEEGFSSKLSVFDPPKMDTSIMDTERVRYYPKSAISEGSPLVFRVEPYTGGYIDGENTTMTVEMKIVNEKNEQVKNTDLVALSNLPLSTIFSQVAVTMSGVEINPDVGSMYPYKNYIEMLLMVDKEAKTSVGEQRGYYQALFARCGRRLRDSGIWAAFQVWCGRPWRCNYTSVFGLR